MDHCDFVFEAVPEDRALKRRVLGEIEDVVPPDTILATNTSSIPIGDLAEAIDDPSRLVGMHYFPPVADVPVVEIIRSEHTSDEALATAFGLARTQGKAAIIVNDAPGFYTNRLLTLYLNEAFLLLEEGADVPTVDQIITEFGFPRGPYELLDFVGLDVAGSVADIMSDHLALDPVDLSDSAQRLAGAGLLGQKSNVGFYHYGPSEDGVDKDRKHLNQGIYRSLGQTNRSTPAPSIVQERLLFMMINAAARCLAEGILRRPRDGDVGAVYGLGFPPYLGGPFRYVDQQGPAQVTKRMRDLAYQYGDRFQPADLLVELEEQDASFHDEAKRGPRTARRSRQ
jgi:3-hydroxyacyl-CoA dehydrogenase/enoyl-CoA hydratase/3-hydroxybutyryl-CoA epimerase